MRSSSYRSPEPDKTEESTVNLRMNPMTYAFFVGCNIPARVSQYQESTIAVFRNLEIDLLHVPEFNCCGYPVRNQNREAFVASAARNLALAEQTGFDMLVMCKCCYGNLKMAQHILGHDEGLNQKIQKILSRENLAYQGKLRIKHLLGVLYHDVGTETLKNYITNPFQNISIAASYGCHALRPSSVTQFDNPLSPSIFDHLVELTGAHSVAWSRKTDCCGAPLMGINEGLSIQMMTRKVTDARESGADYICTACPFTHIQLDLVQKQAWKKNNNPEPLPPILFPQLLGLSMGIDERALGLEKNHLDLSEIQLFMTEE